MYVIHVIYVVYVMYVMYVMYVCMFVCMSVVCMYVCMYVCMHIFLYLQINIYIYITSSFKLSVLTPPFITKNTTQNGLNFFSGKGQTIPHDELMFNMELLLWIVNPAPVGNPWQHNSTLWHFMGS